MRRPVYRYLVGLVAALGACLAVSVCHAALIVDATVQPLSGGLFHYAYAITNNATADAVIVSIINAPLNATNIDTTLAWPAGFGASYDPGLGIVDFFADTSLFRMGMTVGGFAFNSVFGPASGFFSAFEALTVDGEVLSGAIQTQVIPEPGTLALLTLGLGVLALSPMRRRVLCKR